MNTKAGSAPAQRIKGDSLRPNFGHTLFAGEWENARHVELVCGHRECIAQFFETRIVKHVTTRCAVTRKYPASKHQVAQKFLDGRLLQMSPSESRPLPTERAGSRHALGHKNVSLHIGHAEEHVGQGSTMTRLVSSGIVLS